MAAPRTLTLVFAVALALAILAQLVPYGHDHTNPPAGRLVAWDSPQTQDLARRTCFDCHSNETRWPWYSRIAPISWRIQTHVNEGREKLNFSAFEPGNEKVADAAGEAGETVTKGEMPPQDYLLAHPEARLTAVEKAALVRGLEATFAAFGEGREGGKAGQRTPAGVGAAGSSGREPASGKADGDHDRD